MNAPSPTVRAWSCGLDAVGSVEGHLQGASVLGEVQLIAIGTDLDGVRAYRHVEDHWQGILCKISVNIRQILSHT